MKPAAKQLSTLSIESFEYKTRDVQLIKTPIGAASPSSPALLPTLGEGGKNLFKLPPLLALGEEGRGGEGKYSCTWCYKTLMVKVVLN
jgi:hypothetical protein